MSVLAVARAHYRRQVALARRAATDIGRLWARVDRAAIAESWAASVPAAVSVLASAQGIAAASAGVYLDDVLEAQGLPFGSEGRVRPVAFAEIASDGRDVAGLLYQPAITALTGIQQGASVDRAMAGGQLALDVIVRTQVADAGRVADQVAMVARPQVSGYIRLLSLPSCSRCVILAGRFYEWNAGFLRHPRCLPAGVVVSGPRVDAATRRFYQGELVVISTASGQELPITGNHPVLTNRGWVPANLVQEGDDVVRSVRSQGASSLVVPDEDQMPSRVEDLWRPDGVVPLLKVPTSAEDFHGDGVHGEVDVVLADRLLRGGGQAAFGQFTEQEEFSRRVAEAALFAELGTTEQQLFGLAGAAYSVMGSSGLPAARVGRHPSGTHLPSFRPASGLYPGINESAANGGAGDAVSDAEAVFALTGLIGSSERVSGEDVVGPRWDPPAGPLTMESRVAYAERGQDLLLRLTGQVELDRVVKLRRVEWSGHVYNLTSVEGWYSANGLIVSNCDCRHIPASEDTTDDLRTDPKAYFDSLTRAEQDQVFTKAGAEAVRLGADLGQVVNARRGARGLTPAGARITAAEAEAIRGGKKRGRLEAVDVFGRQLFVTSEGVTVRGLAGVRLGAKTTGTRKPGGRYRSAKGVRLMPESILRIAGDDRDEAIRLLKRFGYIT